MTNPPATDLRSNIATWAVPVRLAPAVTRILTTHYPAEAFDPAFAGQDLETTYFDTPGFRLRKARRRGDKYLTLRIRCYRPSGAYALSAKTEGRKFRVALDPYPARLFLDSGFSGSLPWADFLPADLAARLLDLAGDDPLGPAALVCCRRYAVEDERDRFTLDLDVHTDTGKCLPAGVLEFKSSRATAQPPGGLSDLALRPVKVSKFLWATFWR
jgi:hypothetical protein